MGAIASLDYTAEERQKLAKKSLEFDCPQCGKIHSLLGEKASFDNENEAVQAEAREIAAQLTMKGEANQEAHQDSATEPVLLPAAAPAAVAGSASANQDQCYSYMVAAIILALAILLFRRFYSLMSVA